MHVPPMKNPMCTDFEEYKDLTKLVSLNSMEDDATWVVSKLSGSVGALGDDTIEL